VKKFLVESAAPLTLLGGGVATRADVETARVLAPICVAADSGAHLALSAGVEPAAVIGDMDSISRAALARIPPDRLHHIAEQDSTDFDKALRHIAAPVVIAVGFSGGRIDHELAALHTLMVRRERLIVLLCKEDIVFLCPPLFCLPMEAGTRVSLFPLAAVRGRSAGLEWPIDGIDFAPGLRSGTSNRATGDLRLEMQSAGMLCILPRDLIQPVVSVLSGLQAHGRWPVRAE
jgi:thiamine pyrophosphokinase